MWHFPLHHSSQQSRNYCTRQQHNPQQHHNNLFPSSQRTYTHLLSGFHRPCQDKRSRLLHFCHSPLWRAGNRLVSLHRCCRGRYQRWTWPWDTTQGSCHGFYHGSCGQHPFLWHRTRPRRSAKRWRQWRGGPPKIWVWEISSRRRK